MATSQKHLQRFYKVLMSGFTPSSSDSIDGGGGKGGCCDCLVYSPPPIASNVQLGEGTADIGPCK